VFLTRDRAEPAETGHPKAWELLTWSDIATLIDDVADAVPEPDWSPLTDFQTTLRNYHGGASDER
jgi:hypothetical protein